MGRIYNQELVSGTILNSRYKIERTLGAGGFGITYLGHDTKLDMKVAVKEYYDNSEKARAKQMREAQVMARFSGENHIVNVRDFFEENQKTYIVMEYLDGMTLKQYLEVNGKLSFHTIWEMLKPVMNVLEKIHSSGALHRDISPDNIMLVKDGTVKLLDFGSAGDYEEDGQKTVTVVLKPGYAPVEQYQGNQSQGPWIDVYALCGVLYKCITGKTPEDSLKRMFQDELQKPSFYGAQISDAQERILLEGLQLNYQNRISSVKELIEKMTGAGTKEEISVCDLKENVTRTKHVKKYQKEKKFHSHKSKEKTRRKEKGKKAPKQRMAFRLLAGGAVLLAAIFALLLFVDNPYRFEDSHISRIADKKVTKSDLRRVNNRNITSLNFWDCEVSEKILEKLSDLKYLEQIEFYQCSGFSSLTALSEMESLKRITINIDYVQGNELLNGDFHKIEYLTLTTDEFVGGMDFLNAFTGLKGLYFIGDPAGVNNLEFLKNMPNLENFHLPGDGNVDLSGDKLLPLGFCENLDDIDISNTGAENISFAENLPKLTWFKAANNQITNIDALKECSQMYYIDLGYNQISDVSALKNMAEVNTVYLNDNQISDISSFSDMEKMTALYLANNQIADISSLENKELLLTLDLTNNQVSDLMPIYHSKKMSYLYLNQNQLTDLNGCEQMIDLNRLDAADNQIKDISKLNCGTVKEVNFSNNQITDLSVFDGRCGELYLLNINHNQVSDLTPLSAASKLAVLLADHNQLTSLDGLENKDDLYGVSAYGNKITDVSGLPVAKLVYLDLACNQIQDISMLNNLTSSEIYLFLEKNRISDISGLPNTLSYNILSLYGNPISDFSIMPEIQNVNFIYDSFYFSHYDGLDYTPLGQIAYRNNAYAVDVPLEQQSQIKAVMENANGDHFKSVASFITMEEADEHMKEIRDSYRDLLK